MTSTLIHARRAFDGECWRGPLTLNVEHGVITKVADGVESAQESYALVMPGLVDCAVSAMGYSDRARQTDPFSPETAFALLCLRWGVTTVIDINNGLPSLLHLTRLADSHQGPRVRYAGGRLTTCARHRGDLALKPCAVEPVLAGLRSLGAALVSVGAIDEALANAILSASDAPGLVAVTRSGQRETPGIAYARPGTHPQATLNYEALSSDETTYYAPQLEACAHWTVDGLMNADQPELAAPFLPYARHFRRNRGMLGGRIARDVLGRYYGDRISDDLDNRRHELASRHISRATCLAASGVGAPGLVPGRSLWLELQRLAEISDVTSALRAATGSAADALSDASIGRLAEGARADLLLFEHAPDDTITGLREAMTSVMIGGTVLSGSDLARTCEGLIQDALREAE